MNMVPKSWLANWPLNVWIGATIENQDCANERLPHLLRIPATVRFVSCEPLDGPVELSPYLGLGKAKVNWVISGGESGAHAEPSAPQWFRDLRDQCIVAGVPHHFKQWGDWRPTTAASVTPPKRRLIVLGSEMERVGKKTAGRKLDGRVRHQFPDARLPKGWPQQGADTPIRTAAMRPLRRRP